MPPLDVDAVAEVEHGGRPAWEAVVRPTPAYEPRCGCCPLLRSREVDLQEYGTASEHVLDVYPEALPGAARRRYGGLRAAPSEIGGADAGRGHDVRIEAVDEPMDDDLFAEPRRVSFAGCQ